MDEDHDEKPTPEEQEAAEADQEVKNARKVPSPPNLPPLPLTNVSSWSKQSSTKVASRRSPSRRGRCCGTTGTHYSCIRYRTPWCWPIRRCSRSRSRMRGAM